MSRSCRPESAAAGGPPSRFQAGPFGGWKRNHQPVQRSPGDVDRFVPGHCIRPASRWGEVSRLLTSSQPQSTCVDHVRLFAGLLVEYVCAAAQFGHRARISVSGVRFVADVGRTSLRRSVQPVPRHVAAGRCSCARWRYRRRCEPRQSRREAAVAVGGRYRFQPTKVDQGAAGRPGVIFACREVPGHARRNSSPYPARRQITVMRRPRAISGARCPCRRRGGWAPPPGARRADRWS